MRGLQRAVDRYDELVASQLGINRSDLRCLDLLHESGTMTAGQLAAGSGLTSGATTRMLDRLERAGYLRRRSDSGDRRRPLRLLRDCRRRAGPLPPRPTRAAARVPRGRSKEVRGAGRATGDNAEANGPHEVDPGRPGRHAPRDDVRLTRGQGLTSFVSEC